MKKKKSGKKSRRDVIIALVVIMIIIPAGIYFYNQQKMSQNIPQGITSGPFTIDKEKYRLGDNVYMVISGLKPTDTGKMVIYDPKGGTFSQVQFNGTTKSDWNYYFKPNTVRIEKLCTPQDLIGNWTIAFLGTSYRSITFQVINEWVQGAQAEIQPVPAGLSPC